MGGKIFPSKWIPKKVRSGYARFSSTKTEPKEYKSLK
jgi:hypothetical protein